MHTQDPYHMPLLADRDMTPHEAKRIMLGVMAMRLAAGEPFMQVSASLDRAATRLMTVQNYQAMCELMELDDLVPESRRPFGGVLRDLHRGQLKEDWELGVEEFCHPLRMREQVAVMVLTSHDRMWGSNGHDRAEQEQRFHDALSALVRHYLIGGAEAQAA